jgi:AcrR family transcriptional regulator
MTRAASRRATGDKQDRICAAATHVFARKDFHEATISEIAAEAGIGKGTFYLYFESKEDVLVAILHRRFDEMVALLRDLDATSLPPHEAIQLVVHTAIRRLGEDPDLLRIMLQQAVFFHEKARKRFEELFRHMVDQVEGLIRPGVESGLLRRCDPRIAACTLLSAAVSLPNYLTLFPDPDQPPKVLLARLTEELTEFVWASLRRPEDASEAPA